MSAVRFDALRGVMDARVKRGHDAEFLASLASAN
jgi:hypothetical protein